MYIEPHGRLCFNSSLSNLRNPPSLKGVYHNTKYAVLLLKPTHQLKISHRELMDRALSQTAHHEDSKFYNPC